MKGGLGKMDSRSTTMLVNTLDQDSQYSNSDRSDRQGVPWIQTVRGDVFFGSCICLNALTMAIETDYRTEENQGHIGWWFMDSFFNIIFLVEIVLRVRALGRACMRDAWCIMDFFMVSIGVIDSWLLPLVQPAGGADLRVVTLLRLFRMLKLVRVFRLIKLVAFLKELRLLCRGMLQAMRATMWGFVMLAMIIFVCALLVTKIVGKECCAEDDLFTTETLVDYFGTLPRSAFTLFQFTMEFQPDMVRETWEDGHFLTIFLVSYTTLTNIMLLNMLSSVIVDNILMLSMEENKHDEIEREERQRELYVKQLLELFQDFDKDGNGVISTSEFIFASEANPADNFDLQRNRSSFTSTESARSINSRKSVECIKAEKRRAALKAAGLTTRQAAELASVLDNDGSGTISKEEFVRGFERIKGPAQSKHVLKVECLMESLSRKVDRMQAELIEKVDQFVAGGSADFASRHEKGLTIHKQARHSSQFSGLLFDETDDHPDSLARRVCFTDGPSGSNCEDNLATEGKVLVPGESVVVPPSTTLLNDVESSLAFDDSYAHMLRGLREHVATVTNGNVQAAAGGTQYDHGGRMPSKGPKKSKDKHQSCWAKEREKISAQIVEGADLASFSPTSRKPARGTMDDPEDAAFSGVPAAQYAARRTPKPF